MARPGSWLQAVLPGASGCHGAPSGGERCAALSRLPRAETEEATRSNTEPAAGGRASAEGAASRRVASDFGAVGAGRAFTDRRQQVGAAGGRSRTAAFVGSEPSSRRRVRVARLCTRVVRGSPSGSGVTGQLLGRARPFSPPLSGPEAPPPSTRRPGAPRSHAQTRCAHVFGLPTPRPLFLTNGS